MPAQTFLNTPRPTVNLVPMITMDNFQHFMSDLVNAGMNGDKGQLLQKKVNLLVASTGGDIEPAFAILAMMLRLRQHGIEIATYCDTFAHSMAVPIVVNGTPGQRFMSPMATLLVHEMRWITPAAPQTLVCSEMERRAKRLRVLQERYWQSLSTPQCSVGELRQHFEGQGDVIVSAEEALELGWIDAIVPFE